MPRMRAVALAWLSMLLVAGCASSAVPVNSPGEMNRNVLSREQILQVGSRNVYDAVLALRRNWLMTRGIDSLNKPVQVQVYLDDSRLGGVEALREISVLDVAFVRYFNGLEASAKWGLDHGQGAIYVATTR